MKRTGAIILTLFVILEFTFLFGCVRKCNTDHSGSVWVKQTFLDSLQLVASLPPDTVVKDTIIKGDPIYIDKPYPVPVYIDKDSIKHYSDSIQSCDIDARVNLRVKGDLLGIEWKYRPITQQITKEIRIPEPYPVRYEVPVPKPQSGFYLVTGIGKGFTIPIPIISGQIFYINKKEKLIGAEVGYFQKSYYKINFGVKF